MSEPKDVFTLNELSLTNEIMQDLNEWLVGHEGYDEISVKAAMITVQDSNKQLIGTYTLYPMMDTVQFEPNFEPDLVSG